jgi:L-threonylcarbamoyladenylate synthase
MAVEVVRKGGVVLFPTETFYGLGVDPQRRDAVERVYAMKGRPAELALPVLCADWAQLEDLVEVPERHRVRLSRIWPGAVTTVLRCRRDLPSGVAGTVAVRIPGHAMLRTVLYRTGPLTGSSANRHGRPACTEVDSALDSLVEPPDLVLDGGTTDGGQPTTVVDLTCNPPAVIRLGAVPWEEPFPWQDELGRG